MALSAVLNTLVSLASELGIFAIAATVVGWVARDAISQYFNKELAEYQREVDKELNRYQTELEKERLKFSELHTKRANVTAELYEKFVEFEESMRKLTHPMEHDSGPSKDELSQEAADKGNEFMNYYMKNKIYFPPEVCETVEELQEETHDIFTEWNVYDPAGKQRGEQPDSQRWLDLWQKVTEDEVPELKSELEGHFRELLGVDLDSRN